MLELKGAGWRSSREQGTHNGKRGESEHITATAVDQLKAKWMGGEGGAEMEEKREGDCERDGPKCMFKARKRSLVILRGWNSP